MAGQVFSDRLKDAARFQQYTPFILPPLDLVGNVRPRDVHHHVDAPISTRRVCNILAHQ